MISGGDDMFDVVGLCEDLNELVIELNSSITCHDLRYTIVADDFLVDEGGDVLTIDLRECFGLNPFGKMVYCNNDISVILHC